MLVKWIVCTVAPEKRDLFSESQAKWGDVRQVPGFLGQVGGWKANNPSEACILAFWENEDVYKEFMEKHHDPIYEKTNQRGTYEGIQVTACRFVNSFPGSHDHILPSLPEATLMRVNDQSVFEKHSEGLLAGMVCESINEPHRTLVFTLWRGEEAHHGDAVRLEPNWYV